MRNHHDHGGNDINVHHIDCADFNHDLDAPCHDVHDRSLDDHYTGVFDNPAGDDLVCANDRCALDKHHDGACNEYHEPGINDVYRANDIGAKYYGPLNHDINRSTLDKFLDVVDHTPAEPFDVTLDHVRAVYDAAAAVLNDNARPADEPATDNLDTLRAALIDAYALYPADIDYMEWRAARNALVAALRGSPPNRQ